MRIPDQLTDEAIVEVASLLATAYERYAKVRRVQVEGQDTGAQEELDNRRESSPHGQ
ncbi:MAG: hypothetical protein HY820_04495 [Acidobacteria bacterium]|nr:hypothetical protein [Acidobacteriota bacterium]